MRRGVLCLAGLASIITFLLLGAVPASAAVFTVRSDVKDLHFERLKGYDRVTMTDARSLGNPGNPLLPTKFLQIAIPTDVEVQRVEVVSYKRKELPGTFTIWPSQPHQPMSVRALKERQLRFVPPNPEEYGLSSEYPGKLAQVTNNGFLAGHQIAGVVLYPLQYIPAEGKLILYTEIEFQLIHGPTTRPPASVNRRSEKTAQFYSDIVKSVVINPEAVTGQVGGSLGRSDDEIDFLIITADSLVPAFVQLADWKLRKGISTKIETVSTILSKYEGDDALHQIRNCILDYYGNHGTKWVLLGGDTEIISPRRTFLTYMQGVGPDWRDTIPTDYYYSDLDGTWDDNGNGSYGEYPDNIDMYPDVFVGRAPCTDSSEAQLFVDKCLTYEANPPLDYQMKILYAAESLWVNIPTDGSELKEYIDHNFGPDGRDTTKLYQDRDNLNKQTFGAALSAGQHIVNHVGHGSWTSISLADDAWTNGDNDTLSNAPRSSLLYSVSCFSACIDTPECFGESFVMSDNGGGFAYCGNTRYGIGKPGFPLEGPSCELDKEFFKALWVDDIHQLGKTFAYSKIPLIPLSSNPDTSDTGSFPQEGKLYRFAMFTSILLGDPTLELWSQEPETLQITHKSTLYTGEVYLKVDVNQDDALVTCVMEGELLGSAYSVEGTAVVYFDSPPDTTGTMQVTASKRDYKPDQGSVLVEDTTAQCYLVYYSHTAIDSGTNSNGGINPGDTVYMKVTIRNLGSQEPLRVDGTLNTTDTLVSMIDTAGVWSKLTYCGGPGVQCDYFVFACTSSCPDSHLVKFDLKLKVGTSTWADSVFQLVREPDFTIDAVPETAFVRKTDSTDVQVILTSVEGFNTQLQLTAYGLPPEVTGTFYPTYVTPTDTATLRLKATSAASVQDTFFTIYAVGGTYHTKDVIVKVRPALYQGDLWHVSTSGDDVHGDGSEDYPFRTIQKGIDEASSGDTVLVEKGAYLETIDFNGKAILVAGHVIYDSTEWIIDSTIINADDSGSVVVFDSGETNSSILRGFTLRSGNATNGGGIYCYNASPAIVQNKLMDNTCTGKGAGIYCYNSDTSMVPIKIEKTVIHHSTGTGAIYVGGGNDAQLINVTIAHSDTGAYVDSCDVTIKNSILWGNYGCEIVIDTTVSSLNISYSDVDPTNGEGYCGMSDQSGSSGNISVWPEFRDTLLETGDYRFDDSTSPCVNTGDPNDPDIPWWGAYRIDMGAIEFPVLYDIGDVQSDWHINHRDVTYLIAWLYGSGPDCYPPPAGDVDCDGQVNPSDMVYLINYLEKGGPAPPEDCDEKCGLYAGDGLDLNKGKAQAEVMLAAPTISDQGVFEAAVVAKSGVSLAAIELQIEYNPQKITLLEPALAPRTDGFQMYSPTRNGTQKIGILDIQGQNYVAAGVGPVVVLRGTGKDLSSLKIRGAILVDPNANSIPVQIVSQIELTQSLAKGEEANLPRAFSLSQNHPNPFNPDTRISYALPRDCYVTLTIYNVIGQRVATLVDEHQRAGWHNAIWHGKDHKGNDLASGIYLYRLQADDFIKSKKMLLLK